MQQQYLGIKRSNVNISLSRQSALETAGFRPFDRHNLQRSLLEFISFLLQSCDAPKATKLPPRKIHIKSTKNKYRKLECAGENTVNNCDNNRAGFSLKSFINILKINSVIMRAWRLQRAAATHTDTRASPTRAQTHTQSAAGPMKRHGGPGGFSHEAEIEQHKKIKNKNKNRQRQTDIDLVDFFSK